MPTEFDSSKYPYDSSAHGCAHRYLLPAVVEILKTRELSADPRIFEVGCGNGSTADSLARNGYDVTGIDASDEGIAIARSAYPNLKLYRGSAYDDLAERYGKFPVVLSLEVVEHVFIPRKYAHTVYELVQPGGVAIISTPYHGYMKNMALALTGKMDSHFTALWDYGHIKFWSIPTLTSLLKEAGFDQISFRRVGRIPFLAKSMIAIARKAGAGSMRP